MNTQNNTKNPQAAIQEPQGGQKVVVHAEAGQDIVLDQAFEQADVQADGQNIVFVFANGGQVVLDFSELGDVALPNVVLADGTMLSVQEFLASMDENIETAAGPGGLGSGGVGEYRDDPGTLVDGVEKLGVLGPHSFSFAIEPELAARGEDENAPIPPAGPELTPEPVPTPVLPPVVTAAGSALDETGGLKTTTGTLTVSFDSGVSGTIELRAPNATWNSGTQTLTDDNGFWKITLNNGSYTVEQLRPIVHPDSNDPDDSISVPVTVIATDSNNAQASSEFTVIFKDDGPTASPDINSVVEGGTIENTVLTNDTSGTDGWASKGAVVGVKAGNDTSTAVTGQVGAQIDGLYGKLTLNANGTYTYTSTSDVVPPGGATDIFTYTVQDGDGDRSTTTLTIRLTDNTPAPPALAASPASGTVQEAALYSGSNPDSPAETVSGQLSAIGGTGNYTYEHVPDGQTHPGTLIINQDGFYTYTLNKSVLHGSSGVDVADTFTFQVTDGSGNTATQTITINIVDDVPTASPDTNSVVEGETITDATVLTNDTPGADGWASKGAVVGVRAGSDTATAATGQVGTEINGAYGKLTLKADGSYTYTSTSGMVLPKGATDVFTYTVQDGDGDRSTTTLTIRLTDNIVDDVPTAKYDEHDVFVGGQVDVQENAGVLSNDTSGADGWHRVDGDLAGVIGVGKGAGGHEHGIESGNIGSALRGDYGTLTLKADGSYTYQADEAGTGSDALKLMALGAYDANNAKTWVQDHFHYHVQDGDGDQAWANLDITVKGVNDRPEFVVGDDTRTALSFDGHTTYYSLESEDTMSLGTVAKYDKGAGKVTAEFDKFTVADPDMGDNVSVKFYITETLPKELGATKVTWNVTEDGKSLSAVDTEHNTTVVSFSLQQDGDKYFVSTELCTPNKGYSPIEVHLQATDTHGLSDTLTLDVALDQMMKSWPMA